jgi:hypothetical protein
MNSTPCNVGAPSCLNRQFRGRWTGLQRKGPRRHNESPFEKFNSGTGDKLTDQVASRALEAASAPRVRALASQISEVPT